MKKTKIVCTIGPKTDSVEKLQSLATNGMTIARINMAHGSPEYHARIMRNIRHINQNSIFHIGTMLDTLGPEIRTSETEVELHEEEDFFIGVSKDYKFKKDQKHTYVDYKQLVKQVRKKDIINLDDGLIGLEVTKVKKEFVKCKVLNHGILGRRKSVNISGIKRDLPAITKQDIQDIKRGAKIGIDFVAQSFVREAKDVVKMRKLLHKNRSKAMIIAKIEDEHGVDNIDEIIEQADGIMVARGDLGVQMPFEQIPIIQKQIVDKCIKVGKPVIIATQLLESMIINPRPTRAEVTDIANAVIQKADCIMLSAETTKGHYPIRCVQAMNRIATRVESKSDTNIPYYGIKTRNIKEALTLTACINAEKLDAKAIIVFSKTGKLLSLVAKQRPDQNIFVFTDNEKIRKRMVIFRGVTPFKIEFKKNFESMVTNAVKMLKKYKFLSKGDRVVVISDVKPLRKVDILEIREV